MENNFEKSLDRIKEIIEKLESNELSLEESINLYQEGITLTTQCYNKLNEVEKQSIQILEESDISRLKGENINE